MSVIPLSLQEKSLFLLCDRINQLAQGRTNATGTVTLSSTGATSTTVSAASCGASSVVKLSPQTANAAAALATSYIPSTDVTAQQFIVHHSSSTTTDRTFGWVALG